MSTALFWFRQDLRCQDNPALTQACAEHNQLIPLYIKETTPSLVMGEAQCWWLHHSIQALKKSLINQELDLFLQQPLEGDAYILEPHQGKPWRDYAAPKGNITLLIGPEGGFSEDEVNKSFTAGFSRLKLGPRILRTETAAVCALSVVQAIWGDL